MHRFPASRALVRRVSPVAGLAALAAAATAFAAAPVLPVVSNGGARQWIAFDPDGRTIGTVQFLTKTVTIVNASTAANAFTVFYEPQHIAFCAGTLGAGQATLCGTQPTQHFSGGYFQVIATQPVLMGGHSDVPVIRYAQNPQGTFGADTSTGMIQNIPLVWQQGCPPRPGSGCPNGSVTTGVGSVGTVKPTVGTVKPIP